MAIPLDHIRRALAAYEPRAAATVGTWRAAVAMILSARDDDPEVLFIERARRPGDPWSGHMAFPGGRVDRTDPHPRFTAERETQEEVGLGLGPAELLGRLDDQRGRRAGTSSGVVISAYVYYLESQPALQINEEVEEVMWVPMSTLVASTHRVDYRYPLAPTEVFPGILVGKPERHVVWGLTYRFLESFFEIVG